MGRGICCHKIKEYVYPKIIKMKYSVCFLIYLAFTVFSCTYLPDEAVPLVNANYSETSEYITLAAASPGPNRAFLFLPGGLVDPHAYVPLMQRIAQQGTTVIIAKFSANLGVLELNKAKKILAEMPQIKNWYVGGHSLGGISAQAAVNKNPELFTGLILLGAYAAEQYAIPDWPQQVLSIYAENDQLSTVEEIEANADFLPPGNKIAAVAEFDKLDATQSSAIYFLIKGGNHAQFGSYGVQKGDGDATISRDQQHAQVSAAITKFMNWNE